jgi:hypothetical protein
MKGCVLYGRFVFSNPAKNRPLKPASLDKAEANGNRRADSPGEGTGNET